MAKATIKDAVQAVGLDEPRQPAPVEEAKAAPIVVPPKGACIVKQSQRAPAGLKRFRIRTSNGTGPLRYVVAADEAAARAEYLRLPGNVQAEALVVVPLVD